MKALVLHPHNRSIDKQYDERHPLDCLKEAVALAHSLNFEVTGHCLPVRQIRASSFLGRGQCERVQQWLEAETIGLVVINYSLTAVQHRELEKIWEVKLWDRNALILEIFGARARSKEGKLQVELAALRYQRGRLVRSWTHLERQRGGGGFMGGPGESQIESDRRIISKKITRLVKELKKITQNRRLQRKGRAHFPSAVLVGYTNAGKSTLFNRLTHSHVLAKDQLFATLDPTARLLHLPCGRDIILSDTVGFISSLPHHLIVAFHATLEEVTDADIIIHVRDASSPNNEAEAQDVKWVLEQLGVDESTHASSRIIEVFNKADQLSASCRARMSPSDILLSALKGDGIESCLARISEKIQLLSHPSAEDRRAMRDELSHEPPPIV